MTYPIAAISLGAASAYVLATVVAGLVARAGFPLPPEDRRIGCIDGLRGYLALSVLVHHFIVWMQVTYLGGTWSPPSVHLFNQLGAGGVALFFMITGCLFYPRVLAGFRATSWPALAITRVFRIVPLVVASLAVVSAIIALRTGCGLDADFPLAALKWITAWSQVPLLGDPDSGRLNAYVLWSLWYEWLFYLFVLPLCAAAMDLIRGRLPSWTVPAALLVGSLAARHLRLPLSLVLFLPLFAIGMLAYECRRREAIARVLRAPGMALAALLALGFGMVAFPTPHTLAMPFFAVFFVCVACGNSLGGLLRGRGALVLGECSYGIYLLHGIVLSLLFVEAAGAMRAIGAGWAPALLPPAAALVTLTAAAGYLIVERPGIRLGGRLAKRLPRHRPGAAAPALNGTP